MYYQELGKFLDRQKLKIMELLFDNLGKDFTAPEIAKKTGIGRSTGTRLQELVHAGLIRSKKRRQSKGARKAGKAYETAEHAIKDFIRRMQADGFADEKPTLKLSADGTSIVEEVQKILENARPK